MRFNKHYDLVGKHAVMSPSSYSWVNYDVDKMAKSVVTSQNARRGTLMHEVASNLIKLGVKLPDTKKTMNQYVNDAIGFKMTTELPLFFSWNCFGTADAVSCRQELGAKRFTLRIHDLKTGTTPTKIMQLIIYAVIFCIEYNFEFSEIDIILRIYKSDEFEEYIPDLPELIFVKSQMVTFSKLIDQMDAESVV